ncbi:MAG: MFS transporter [Pseudohongiellaceae bacterium]
MTTSEHSRDFEPVPGARPRWLVVSALGIMQIFAWGGSFYLLTIISGPITTDTGWPLPWIIGSLSAGLLVAGMVSPAAGRAIDKRGGRFVLALSSPLLAAGLVVIGFAQSLPVFIAGWLIMGLGMGSGLYDAAFSTLGQIYRTRARTAITALTLWGGFSSTVSWPLTAWLVDQVGWRGACFAYAGIQMLVCLPLVLTLIPRPPVNVPRDDVQTIASDSPLSRTESRQFLLLALAFMTAGTTFSILTIHLLVLLQAQGVTLESAVLLGTLIGPAQVAGRIVEMSNRGRHHPLWTLTAAIILIASGLILLATGFAVIGVALILYGAGNGIFSIARGTVPLALFGPDRYAIVMGRLARPALLAQALAPVLAAWFLNVRSPDAVLNIIAVLALFNALVVASLWLVVRHYRS